MNYPGTKDEMRVGDVVAFNRGARRASGTITWIGATRIRIRSKTYRGVGSETITIDPREPSRDVKLWRRA